MPWLSCTERPPLFDGKYEVLVLDHDIHQGAKWLQTNGKYENGQWTLWMDGYGWYNVNEVGYKPYFWCSLPPLPPVPYEGPVCIHYKGGMSYAQGYCFGQKNTPSCSCQGNKEKCECCRN